MLKARKIIRVCKSMASPPNWLELPPEITGSILGRIGAIDILVSARKVCRSWRQICSDPAMWRIVDLTTTRPVHQIFGLDPLAWKAVDLSCGQLIDITFHQFVHSNTLLYTSNRYSIFCILIFLLHTYAMLFI